MDFLEVVHRRRMVRHFSDEPVDRSTLERIAATAQRTPSAGFSQGQRLVIVTDPDRKGRVAAIAQEAEYVSAGYDAWLTRAPALFVPFVSVKVYRDRYDEPDKRPPG
jgi:FMN reductase [NAD(P)H]